MQLTCPTCHDRFPIAAGFLDDDGKRLAAQLAGMEPVLGRAVIGYLRLFKPAKQGLRSARAVKIVAELEALVRTGSVCRDERGGVRRPATPDTWAAGIEQMLAEADKLTLPLGNHNYLRAIVYSLADKADAAGERQREADKRAGRHLESASGKRTNMPSDASERLALHNALARVQADLDLGLITPNVADTRKAEARKAHGGNTS